jgi:hypothetical protein
MKKYLVAAFILVAMLGLVVYAEIGTSSGPLTVATVKLNVAVQYPSGRVPAITTVYLTQVTSTGAFVAEAGHGETTNGLVTFTDLVPGRYYQGTATHNLASMTGEPGEDKTIWGDLLQFRATKYWQWKTVVMKKHLTEKK